MRKAVPHIVAVGLFSLLASCADDPQQSSSDALTVFENTNEALHAMHVDYFDIPEGERPEEFIVDCEGGGRVVMTVPPPESEGAPFDLLHEMEDCSLDGVVMNGPVDYLRIDFNACDRGISLDIVGELSLSGDMEGSCTLDVAERCGGFSGSRCGNDF